MMTLRFELGLPGFPFDHSYKRFNLCSTPIYLHCAWEFCNEHEFRIQDNQPQLTLQRVDDQYIMQAFAEHGYTDKQLKNLISAECGQKSFHSPTSQPATANTSLRNAKKKIAPPIVITHSLG
jgi:hypothetical protein